MRRDHSQPDEGFSETRSLADSDMAYSADGDTSVANILDMVVNLPAEQRAHIVESVASGLPTHDRHQLAALLIRTLPNTVKESLGSLCERLTKFDPVYTLPNELMLQVLSYLDPIDLLKCSKVSKTWRPRTTDERLWRGCFAREGWVVDSAKISQFEERERRKINGPRTPSNPRGVQLLQRKGSRKRKTEEAFSEGEAGPDAAGDSMDGVEASDSAAVGSAAGEGEGSITRRGSTDSAVSMDSTNNSQLPDLQISPPLFRPGSNEDPKISWPYLYKQRCRLERNWDQGLYKKFQLPHFRHPGEGHTECVYTIQHTPQYLVSGSRDKTIRIWNLETQRLIRDPLRGHEASVLCLQFDDRPDHDIIVSGGSDSYVIVWQFSTGKILKKLTNAHHESVLNLRFDDNYIVTCSKDKLIKVWNRRNLARNSPLVPEHVLSTLPHPTSEPEDNLVKAYTLFATLAGHQAAVNAVIIHDSTIVSASGDRSIKSWSLPSGKLNKTYIGHTKGIACVQYDGRRIVSGSSDNTVRIFDAENQAEVACLSSHSNLVRTVQARFGDLDTVTADELEQEAQIADRAYFEALGRGMQPASVARGARRNAGSSRPDKILSTGTKVPPGGGGGRWAKIVSGSYDENVQIWKKGEDGEWVVKKTLPLRGDDSGPAGVERVRRIRAGAVPGVGAPGAASVAHQLQQHLVAAHHHQHNAPPPSNGPASQASAAQALPPPPTTTTTTAFGQAHHHHHHHHQNQQQQQQQAHAANPPPPPPAATTTTTNTTNAATAPVPATAPLQAPTVAPLPPPTAAAGPTNQPFQPQPQPPPQQHHHHHHPRGSHSDSNRVFKLQFDARRIVCCSQNKVIVGWDFANGDRELELMGGWSVETA